MVWASAPEGPWSEPVLVLNSTTWNSDYFNRTGRIAQCDGNVNGVINADGSFVGLWRRCQTPALYTIPHTISASNWRDASTYTPDPHPLFVLGGSGAEDPSNIWTTTSVAGVRAYHALFHDEQVGHFLLLPFIPHTALHPFSEF
jgi:hypothetical protein